MKILKHCTTDIPKYNVAKTNLLLDNIVFGNAVEPIFGKHFSGAETAKGEDGEGSECCKHNCFHSMSIAFVDKHDGFITCSSRMLAETIVLQHVGN